MFIPELVLVLCGIPIGIFSVVIGGGMFFSMPLMQFLFPQASIGVLVGNLKVGSFCNFFSASWANRRQIDFHAVLSIGFWAFLGSMAGAWIISDIDQKCLFFFVVAAVFLTAFAPIVSQWITPKRFHVFSVLIGLYCGFLGAGAGLMILALVRLKYPDDAQIAFAKIQRTAIEVMVVVMALISHAYHGNLIPDIFIPWTIGTVIGGFAGAMILNHMTAMPTTLQKTLLYSSFVVALFMAGWSFLKV